MSKILTESNIKKLQEELDYRMTVRRAEIAKEKLIAAAHGDRSENAEYKAACEEYRENDNRIQHLLTLITTATVIDDESIDKSILGINTAVLPANEYPARSKICSSLFIYHSISSSDNSSK